MFCPSAAAYIETSRVWVFWTGNGSSGLSCGAAVFLLLALALPKNANGSGLRARSFDPSERGSEWFANESLDFFARSEKWRPAAGIVFEGQYRPLAIYNTDGASTRRSLPQCSSESIPAPRCCRWRAVDIVLRRRCRPPDAISLRAKVQRLVREPLAAALGRIEPIEREALSVCVFWRGRGREEERQPPRHRKPG